MGDVKLRRLPNLPLKERIKLYNKAMKLHEKGLGYRRIANRLNLYSSAVKYWIYKGGKPGSFWNNPDLNPSSELSFILGVYYSDGTAVRYKSCYKIALEVTDLDYLEEFNRCLSKILGRTYPIRHAPFRKFKGTIRGYEVTARKEKLRIEAYSKILYQFLKKGDHVSIINEHPRSFLRGFADGDGSVRIATDGNSQILLCNSDLDTLYLIKKVLEDLDFTPAVCKQGLLIYRYADVQKWYEEIGFSIKRKEQKLMEGLTNVGVLEKVRVEVK